MMNGAEILQWLQDVPVDGLDRTRVRLPVLEPPVPPTQYPNCTKCCRILKSNAEIQGDARACSYCCSCPRHPPAPQSYYAPSSVTEELVPLPPFAQGPYAPAPGLLAVNGTPMAAAQDVPMEGFVLPAGGGPATSGGSTNQFPPFATGIQTAPFGGQHPDGFNLGADAYFPQIQNAAAGHGAGGAYQNPQAFNDGNTLPPMADAWQGWPQAGGPLGVPGAGYGMQAPIGPFGGPYQPDAPNLGMGMLPTWQWVPVQTLAYPQGQVYPVAPVANVLHGGPFGNPGWQPLMPGPMESHGFGEQYNVLMPNAQNFQPPVPYSEGNVSSTDGMHLINEDDQSQNLPSSSSSENPAAEPGNPGGSDH